MYGAWRLLAHGPMLANFSRAGTLSIVLLDYRWSRQQSMAACAAASASPNCATHPPSGRSRRRGLGCLTPDYFTAKGRFLCSSGQRPLADLARKRLAMAKMVPPAIFRNTAQTRLQMADAANSGRTRWAVSLRSRELAPLQPIEIGSHALPFLRMPTESATG
jgi:hypothetical protein